MGLSIKKQRIVNILGLFISLAYGLFTYSWLLRLFSVGSGDIGSYVGFFEDTDFYTSFYTYTFLGDGLFRVSILFLMNFFDKSPIIILSSIAFITSTIIFYISLLTVRSKPYLLLISPIFLLIFFTPIVFTLFSSALRSGIAFALLIIAFNTSSHFLRFLFFGLASFLHLSMIVIIALYFSFNFSRNSIIQSSFFLSVSFLIFLSFSAVTAVFLLKLNVSGISQSIFYNLLILYLGVIMTFINKKVLQNLYGFIAIGLIFIFMFGLIFDIFFLRLIGNSLVFYLLYLLQVGEKETIKIFTIAFLPFFLITWFYTLTNV